MTHAPPPPPTHTPYTDLMKHNPDLMTTALHMHNNMLIKAKWQNFGYTVEQEGDR